MSEGDRPDFSQLVCQVDRLLMASLCDEVWGVCEGEGGR